MQNERNGPVYSEKANEIVTSLDVRWQNVCRLPFSVLDSCDLGSMLSRNNKTYYSQFK